MNSISKRIGIFLTFSLLTLLTYAQNSYVPIRSAGKMPKSVSNYVLVEQVSGKMGDQFNQEVDFVLSTLFRSGKVLYGDSLTSYVNKCADLIYTKNDDIEQVTEFFVIKNTAPNAFALPNGMIFITTGLLGQMENEAQLMFVLSHEISHVEKQHGWESFQDRVDILSGKGDYKGMDIDSRINLALRKSKKHELEADKIGFKRFSNLGYASTEALRSFDVLLYSYLPFDEVEFNYNYFQDSFYQFPESYKDFETNEIDADEFEDDEEQTHPNIASRKDQVSELIKDTSSAKRFIISEASFKRVQRIARYENTQLLVNNGALDKAFYNAYLLEKHYGKSEFTHRIKTYCAVAYCISKYSSDLSSSDFRESKSEIQGNTQYLTVLLSKLKQKETLVLAKRLLLEGHQKYPNDAFYSIIQADLDKKTLKKWTPLASKQFLPSNDLKTVKTNGRTGNSKIDKLKTRGVTKSSRDSSTYYNWGLYSLNPSGKDLIWLGVDRNWKSKSEEDDEEDEEDYEDDYDEFNSKKKNKNNKVAKANNSRDTLNLLYPNVVRIVAKSYRVKRDKVSDEELAAAVSNSLIDFGSKLDVDVVSADPVSSKSMATSDYNNFSFSKNWIRSYDNLKGGLTPLLSFDSLSINQIGQNKGIATIDMLSVKQRREFNYTHLLVMIVIPYSIPFYAVHYAVKENFTILAVKIYNIDENKLANEYNVFYEAGGNIDYLKAHLYSIISNYAEGK